MISATRWCVEHQPPATRIVIATDSQSLCQALLGHSPVVDELKGMLDLCCGSISIQWIPGHADIPGNEMADMDAKKAATICNESPRGTSFRGVLPAINNAIADAPITPPHCPCLLQHLKETGAPHHKQGRPDHAGKDTLRPLHSFQSIQTQDFWDG